jgi:hypothetical protein
VARSFKTQLAGQIGESLVVAELGRRGIVATSFAGNVPDIDLLAYANHISCHLQVKSWRNGSVQFDAKRFLEITFDGTRQIIGKIVEQMDDDLIFVFVKIGEIAGADRFFLLRQSDLQSIIVANYGAWLGKHDGIRPRNPLTTHSAVQEDQLAPFEGNWALIVDRFAE